MVNEAITDSVDPKEFIIIDLAQCGIVGYVIYRTQN